MHVPVVTKIQSAPPWHSSPYKVGISRTYEYLLYVMKAVIFLLLAVVFTIAPIAQAEDDIVTEVLSQGGIPGLIKHYRKIVAQIAKGGANVAAPLNMLMTKIRQKSKLRIDTYHAHWRWHGTYDTCKDEYEGVLQYLRNILDTGGSITSATIESIISQRSCSIWAAVPEQEFFVISELLQRYRQENGSGWNLAKIDEIVEEIASSYDGQTEPIPALYYVAKAEVLLALGDEVGAVKIIHAGLEKYKEETHLIDELFQLLADPTQYDFKQIWLRKLGPIASSGPRLSNCPWVEELGKCNSWDEALAKVDATFASCQPKVDALGVSYVVRAFLHTGKFQWKAAQSYIESVVQSSAFRMVSMLQQFRDSLVFEFLMPFRKYRGRGDPAVGTMRLEVNRVIAAASRPPAPIKPSPTKSTPKTVEKPIRPVRVEDRVPPPSQEPPRPENQIAKQFSVHSKSSQGDRSLGNEAMRKFYEFLRSDDLWAAKKAYDVASYNLYFSDVQVLQSEWDEVLGSRSQRNRRNLDPAIMGFGWRVEFWKVQEQHWEGKHNAIQAVQLNSLLDSPQVAEILKVPGLSDPRPDPCERMLDVAEVFAQAKKFSQALQIAKKECGDNLKLADEARLLQAFVEGLHDEYRSKDHNISISHVLEYVTSNLERGGDDWHWSAAALSLHKILSSIKTIDGTQVVTLPKPLPADQQVGRPGTVYLKRKTINVDQLKQFIDDDNTVENLDNYIPVIKSVFETQKKERGLNALYLYVEAMRHLLMKMNDVGRAIPWWEMSIKTCSRRTDFDDLHIAKAKMEADAFGGLRSMTTRNPAVFSSLVARFESKRKGSRTTSRGSSRRDSGRRRT